MLVDLVNAYQSAADTLGYFFKFGTLEDNVNIPSNANDQFIWIDRPVTGSFNKKLLQTGVGDYTFGITLNALQRWTQQRKATSGELQAIWDAQRVKAINIISSVSQSDTMYLRALGNNTEYNLVHAYSIHSGKYIGITVNLTYNFTYCE